MRAVETLESRFALDHSLVDIQAGLGTETSRDDVVYWLNVGGSLIDLPHPHPGNPQQQAEHEALFRLVPVGAASHVLSTGTWSGGTDETSKVLIPAGQTVTLSGNVEARWVRVLGTLKFADNAHLTVDTMITDPGSTLEIGTSTTPIDATITFIGGDIDDKYDPFQLSRGLIAHGLVTIHGEPKEAYAESIDSIEVDATTITLTAAPTGWEVGDVVLIAGTTHGVVTDDVRTITAIDDETITLDCPIEFDHPTLYGHLPRVSNLTRSVVFESETPSGTRGHVMVMHSGVANSDIRYAAFEELGRTDFSRIITDPALDFHGLAIPATLDNPRGRYSLHFHRGGTEPGTPPAEVYGSVVVGAPKLGFVNHASHVNMEKNVAYNVSGSHFFTEVGSEIGEFRDNVAVRSLNNPPLFVQHGSQEILNLARKSIGDVGFTGVGFWFGGGGVETIGNFFAGVNTGLFIVPGNATLENGAVASFHRDNLEFPAPEGTPEQIVVTRVPFTFNENVGFGGDTAVFAYHGGATPPAIGAPNRIEDNDFIGFIFGTALGYTQWTEVRNTRVIGNIAVPTGTAFGGNGVESDVLYENVTADGFAIGIAAPIFTHYAATPHDIRVNGATLGAMVGIYVPHFALQSGPISYLFEGTLTFTELENPVCIWLTCEQLDYYYE